MRVSGGIGEERDSESVACSSGIQATSHRNLEIGIISVAE